MLTAIHQFVTEIPGWVEDAACAGHDPELWFPKSTASPRTVAICHGCPVRHACLDYALRTRQRHGIWGGLTINQRRRILEHRQETAA